jgi:ATP-dependent protease ClpP protease subunit
MILETIIIGLSLNFMGCSKTEGKLTLKKKRNNILSIEQKKNLFKDRIILLNGEITQSSSSSIIAQLLLLEREDPKKPIYLYINCTNVMGIEGRNRMKKDEEKIIEDANAIAIYDTIQYIRTPVHTICIGSAIGISSLILAGGEPGNRSMLPNSKIMLDKKHLELYQNHTKEIKLDSFIIINSEDALRIGIVDQIL